MRSPASRRFSPSAARGLTLLALVASGAGCPENNHVGRPCEIGTVPIGGSNGQIATVSSPALECPSHICLHAGESAAGTGALCTAPCESNQDCEDGERAAANDPADTRCRGGFACMWPTTVGSFACQKLCVCTDFVGAPPGGFTKPLACR
jgi:hypothetical protein